MAVRMLVVMRVLVPVCLLFVVRVAVVAPMVVSVRVAPGGVVLRR